MKTIKILTLTLLGAIFLHSCSAPIDKNFVKQNLISAESVMLLGVNIGDSMPEVEKKLKGKTDWEFKKWKSEGNTAISMKKEWSNSDMSLAFHSQENKVSKIFLMVNGKGEDAVAVRKVNDELQAEIEGSSNYKNIGRNKWHFKESIRVDFTLDNFDGSQVMNIELVEFPH